MLGVGTDASPRAQGRPGLRWRCRLHFLHHRLGALEKGSFSIGIPVSQQTESKAIQFNLSLGQPIVLGKRVVLKITGNKAVH